MRTFDGVPITAIEYFLGKDKRYAFHIYTDEHQTTSQDVTGIATNFMVKRRLSDADVDAIMSLGGSVSGTFSATPSANLQRVYVLVEDTNTDTEIPPGVYYWELIRTDAAAEVVLAFGPFTAKQAVHIA